MTPERGAPLPVEAEAERDRGSITPLVIGMFVLSLIHI